MKVRVDGTPQNLDRKTVFKALRYFAKTLLSPTLIETLSIRVIFESTRGFKASVEWTDRPERAKQYRIVVRDTLSAEMTLLSLAHEMVHVKQYATGQMRDYLNEPDFVRWEKERYVFKDENSEQYWFAPWEVEAYGKERGLTKLFVKQLTK